MTYEPELANGGSRSAVGVRVREAPLARHHAGDGVGGRTELGDEVLLRAVRIAPGAVGGTERLVVAVRPDPTVVVVLDHDGVRAVVRVDRRGDVPAEQEVSEKLAGGAEVH